MEPYNAPMGEAQFYAHERGAPQRAIGAAGIGFANQAAMATQGMGAALAGAQQLPEVPREIERLMHAAERLHNTARELVSRIAPVMRPESPTEALNRTADEPCTSGVAQALSELRGRLNTTQRELADALHRLAI